MFLQNAATRQRESETVRIENDFDMYNGAYVQALYEQYLQNPANVDAAWRTFFEAADGQSGLIDGARPTLTAVPREMHAASAEPGAPAAAELRAARAAGELVDAYRLHGHRAARIDPLGSTPAGHPMLEPEFHGITEDELEQVPASMLSLDGFDTMGQFVEWLHETYTGTIGYEFEYLEDPTSREWLREQIETGAHRQPLSKDEKRRLLERLSEVESLEQFLHRAYLGAKRFSIEGNDMLVPMLDLAIERTAAHGGDEVVIGMAHRGRLNVLAHVLGVSYADLIEKFEGRHSRISGTGDVKYHLGAEGTYATTSGEPLTVSLAPNPSHLEFVDPVVLGMARAKQTDRRTAGVQRNEDAVVPVLIHGDAAFSGQGVVAETLNLAKLIGFRTGGTLHIICNNQVGFTTDPRDARSTDYASDMARGFDVPIFHVNADDPEACLAVVRLAMEFRANFHSDVVIDLVGYRRYGHNEGDEPAYTQPVMYAKIASHPTVRSLWADRLVGTEDLDRAAVDAIAKAPYDRLVEVQEKVRAAGGDHDAHPPLPQMPRPGEPIETGVPADQLRDLDRQLHAWPDDFKLMPKLARQLEKRSRVLAEGGSIDWGHAEALAFASLLTGGVALRMSGQDTERGTFSHRHLVLHDSETGRTHAPLAHLDGLQVPFEIYNSPLSELAVMGFEYGYSVVAPETLVLWEAQFGDFVNGAQVILDQFLAAGRAKWGQESRLALLLPHGYEGQGPEHSSARLERFLQLCAENNMRVANCTTPAQYFHLLRRQALLEEARPLVVMTPKSLLRHPRAVSSLTDLAEGSFHKLISDPFVHERPQDVRRIVLCSGKIYYDLLAAREKQGAEGVALVRLEQIYPLPEEDLAALFAACTNLRDVVWAQEEPANMGAWRHVEVWLREGVGERDLRYAGRPDRASPAEGYATDHEREQARIVSEALADVAPASRRRSGRAGSRRPR
jgi:2-oxoglutarate dehydrogenase E1 component